MDIKKENQLQKDIKLKRQNIEEKYKYDKDKLIIILEQIAGICRRNRTLVGEGVFTEFCKYLYENGYDGYHIGVYLKDWRSEVLENI